MISREKLLEARARMSEKPGMIMSNEEEDVEQMFKDKQQDTELSAGDTPPGYPPPGPHDEARMPKSKRVADKPSQ